MNRLHSLPEQGYNNCRMKANTQVTTVKQNGDKNRRPSYPGDQRVKHANITTKIWVKVAMTIAYFLCVSIAAFILTIYYVFFWSPDPVNSPAPDNVTIPAVANNTTCQPRL